MNRLEGRLPDELGNLRKLDWMLFSDNPGLRGLIPASFVNMEQLSELQLHNTGLCAPLNEEFQDWVRGVEHYFPGDNCSREEIEALALDRLFDDLDGESWANGQGWEPERPASARYGVTVEGGRVSRIRLADNGLRGRLPDDLATLIQLGSLDVSDNDLDGGIPPVYAGMPNLGELRAGGNARMEGRIPYRFVDSNLRALDIAGTGMCVSPGRSFQAWWRDLQHAAGALCDNPSEVRISFPSAYLVQSVQGPQGHVRTVAGRDALLRAFVTGSPSPAYFEFPVVATFTHRGSEVHRVEMRREDDILVTEMAEGDLTASYNAVIPGDVLQPGVQLVLEADPDGVVPLAAGSRTRYPSSGAVALDVVDVPPMKVTVVPVYEAADPDRSIDEWTKDFSGESPQAGLFRHAFPFRGFEGRVREPYYTSLDITSEADRLLDELTLVREAEDGTGYYYGAGASVNGYVRGYAWLGGWVSMGKAWDTELAHEVGHNLDLRHAPCGGAGNTDPGFPHEDGGIGYWGYDFRDGTLVDPVVRRDIMGYCYNLGWLSDYYFEKVIDYRERVEGERGLVAGAPDRGEGPRRPQLVLWGGATDGELRLQPALTMVARTRRPLAPGPYRLEGIGRDGRAEFSFAFTPGEDKYGGKHFYFALPLDPAWEATLEEIRLTGPEGEVRQGIDENRPITVVTDRRTGRVRAILHSANERLPDALADPARFEASTVSNLRGALRGAR